MAIAYNASDTAFASLASSVSKDLGCSGDDRLAIISVQTGGSNTITSVTVEGSPATLIDTQVSGAQTVGLYYFVAPPTGATTTYTANVSTSLDDTRMNVMIYTGCNQSSPIDSSGKGTDASGAITLSTTVVASDCWLVGATRSTSGNTATNGSGLTLRQANGQCNSGDSNATVATGSQSMTWNYAGTNSAFGVIASIAVAVASGPANLKSLDTNVKANIKSYNTNVLANIKSINTNA